MLSDIVRNMNVFKYSLDKFMNIRVRCGYFRKLKFDISYEN